MKTSTVSSGKYLTKFSALITLFLLTCISLTSCSGDDSNTTETSTTPPISSGTKAPEFNLNSSDGKQVKLSDYNGKVVVLFFFGNTCPSCKAAAPSIESKLTTPYASNPNYQIIGLDQWDGNLAAVQSFRTSTGVSFPLLLTASPVAASYKTTYDRLIVINKTGDIAFTGTKGAASDADAAKAVVDQLLK
ncbi:TlpA family protein disulfide reductase [Flavobacterium glaciei]|uniref:Peroxiredoxin n=1 Tax=Flavobacterium glaciei TaxID=386300 RepID=A0A562Q1L9_9FLAO|nr:TlpA family protein disulfide reductase [Flavobacterium glaciei]RDI57643.1 peroxiredoxin [Flavobacterium glaciei]TWI50557.1 peroxiredoxin [Flavobacterium glaciei]